MTTSVHVRRSAAASSSACSGSRHQCRQCQPEIDSRLCPRVAIACVYTRSFDLVRRWYTVPSGARAEYLVMISPFCKGCAVSIPLFFSGSRSTQGNPSFLPVAGRTACNRLVSGRHQRHEQLDEGSSLCGGSMPPLAVVLSS